MVSKRNLLFQWWFFQGLLLLVSGRGNIEKWMVGRWSFPFWARWLFRGYVTLVFQSQSSSHTGWWKKSQTTTWDVQKLVNVINYWVLATQIFFYVYPQKLGKMNPFWRAYFTDGGWFNHQLDYQPQMVQPPDFWTINSTASGLGEFGTLPCGHKAISHVGGVSERRWKSRHLRKPWEENGTGFIP